MSQSHTESTITSSQARRRHLWGRFWLVAFQISTIIGVIALTTLLLTIINKSFGYAAIENRVNPEQLAVSGVPLEELPKELLIQQLRAKVSAGLFRRFEYDRPFEERIDAKILQLI